MSIKFRQFQNTSRVFDDVPNNFRCIDLKLCYNATLSETDAIVFRRPFSAPAFWKSITVHHISTLFTLAHVKEITR